MPSKNSSPRVPKKPGQVTKLDQTVEPIDQDHPPRLSFPIVGIGASAGGLEAISSFLQFMRPDSGMAFVFIQHLPPQRESMLTEILARQTKMPVLQVEDHMPVQPNHVYVIRPGHTLTIHAGKLLLGDPLKKKGHGRPVDDFFRSLAEEQRERAIGVVLSGMGSNGTAGAQAIKAVGGICVAQDPESAKFPSMPRSLIEAGVADYILRCEEIPEVLLKYASHPYATRHADVDPILRKEPQQLHEILAILRTRTRHEFSGYKKPTLVRRIQRRMGLNQLATLADYAKLLRQRPSEVQALADDLMINVTGFFRDPDAWDSLVKLALNPLVGQRDADTPVRAWVTACSSGEEAYTLAMLLVEAADSAGKHFDIKIFATDTAERTLGHARNGIYPGGIESEIPPARLERFFEKDDHGYRIKRELREMVVFAPHDLLRDPPFSHLDVICCRNLLIYLEPNTQKRALALLHFGLRDGGALFLGNSETAFVTDNLFEPIDKRWRIFRRVGPTRHGLVEFPIPSALKNASDSERLLRGPGRRASVPQIAQRVLMDHFTPPAVVVDRQNRIAYFHGNTEKYIIQPAGEPTFDLLVLARESMRGAIRSALQKAALEKRSVAVRDGWTDLSGDHRRIVVTASPLDAKEAPGHFLVSFSEELELPAVSSSKGKSPAVPADHLEDELRRVRGELQSTVEELQTSNEELKASNEEITSINEELQSTNEEMETSKEELQSLNEELTTVNAQLLAKMDELQAATNDLSSLLSSTDIAVLFLDTQFHIRRFTPAFRNLIEVLPSDVGRPIADLAPKFFDPHLMEDIRGVLDHLIPIEKEINGEAGRLYLRRILPYRTSDNRIEGVVITFVDITLRKRAEESVRQGEERHRLILQSAREYAIFMLEPDGKIATWNSGAERIFGFSQADAIGKPVNILFPPDARASGEDQKELALARETGSAADERWHVRRDGARFWGSGVLSAVRDSDGQLRGFTKILRDNTDRKHHEEAMKQAKQGAEAANNAKDHFLASLSHELRTPLTAILLWARILRDLPSGPARDAQFSEAIEAILNSASSQKRLIEDLLDIARMTSGRLRIIPRDTDMAEVVRSAVEAVRATAEAKNIRLESQIDPVDIIRADPDRIQQIVWNLLANAIKFTADGGSVSIRLFRNGDNVEIQVSDTGKGISSDFLPFVFDRFRQQDAHSAHKQGGLGLGLAIAKQLVELHGGTLSAQSDGDGKGACFTAAFPLPSVPHSSSSLVSQNNTIHGKPLRGAQLLLVEDETDTRNALSRILQNCGAGVISCGSAEAGFDAFSKSRPDVVISDVGMPEQDGYSLIQRIRLLETTAGRDPVPAIALTAYTRDEDRRRAEKSGFQHHLSKPVDLKLLLTMLVELLGKPEPALSKLNEAPFH